MYPPQLPPAPHIGADQMGTRSHTVSERVPVQVRCKTREAFELSRYMRVTLIVNLPRSAGRTVKVDQMSRGLCLLASTHLIFTSGKHLFNLEPTS